MTAMDMKTNSARVLDLSTRFETIPVDTEAGPVLWADVEITYILAGLTPTVNIRVPVPFVAGETENQRKSQALRHARPLIDHACQVAAIPPEKPVTASVQAAFEEMLPASLQGVTQEPGLAMPTAKPKGAKPSKP